MPPSKTFLLCDAYSLIYRAFYAIRNLTTPEGKPANAIYGFVKMLGKLQLDYTPSHIGIVFDLGAPEARLEILPQYKAQRPPTPPDLESQLPMIREIIPAMGLTIVELEGEEADDIIASLSTSISQQCYNVLIASSDKDLFQLVTDKVKIITGKSSGVDLVDSSAVMKRFGVRPDQIVDFLSLVGDSADNIPGVIGIGEKTAANLLGTFGSIDELIKNSEKIKKSKIRTAITSCADQLQKNQSLISLRKHLDLPFSLDDLRIYSKDTAKLQQIYQQLGFKSLLADIEKTQNNQGDLFK